MLSKFADYKPKLQNPRRRTVPIFQHVCDEWWEKKSKTLALGSLKSYVPCVARAVDVYGGYRMNEILPGHVAALLNDMKDAGFSQKVISNQHSVISQIFDYWIEKYGGENNPSRMIRSPRGGTKVRRTRPTKAHRALLEQMVDVDGGGLFMGFLLYSSARRGEVLALQYKDIDLQHKLIHITKSVTYMGNAPIVGATKTESGVRDNPILAPFEPYLQQLMAKHHKASDYIFGGEQPLTSSQFNKLWLDLLEPAGLTEITDGNAWKGNRKQQRHALITPHQLRHEYAYTLYKAGVPELLAKTLMGHSDIAVTHNIYTELGADDVDESKELLNAYFERKSRPNPENRPEKCCDEEEQTA